MNTDLHPVSWDEEAIHEVLGTYAGRSNEPLLLLSHQIHI